MMSRCHLAPAFALLCGCGSGLPDLCQLSEAQSDYADRVVTVEGVLGVSRHETILRDPSCDRAVRITWDDGDSRFRVLDDAYDRAQTVEATARLKVTGRLVQSRHPTWGIEGWELQLDSAEVMAVELLESPRTDF